MACPNCGGATGPDDAFCAHCGTNLAEAPVTCSNCGKVNEPKAAFCTACGTSLTADAEPAAPVADEASADAAETEGAAEVDEASADAAATEGAAKADEPVGATDPEPPAEPTEAAAPPATGSMKAAETTPPPATTPAAAPAATPSPAGGRAMLPISIGAAAVAALGALLAWVDVFGQSSNSFDSPIQFLIDWETGASNTVSVGAVVLVLAGVAAALAYFSTAPNRIWIIRFMGLALIAVAASFLVQLAQAADGIGSSFGDVYGIGPFFTLVGGAGLLTGK